MVVRVGERHVPENERNLQLNACWEAKRGEIQKCKIEEAFDCWKANAMKGNSYKLIYRMEKYYQELWRTL